MPCENSRFRVGQVIGSYTLLECKGEGGFGEVWKAQRKNVMAAPPVALKLSRYPQLHQNAVRKEAELWVKATGLPNVLPVIEASVYNNEVAIVSHYVDGGTLTQWLQQHKGKAPSVAAAVEIMAGILMGLEGLHSRGIVHRDLKPDNILMQGEMPLLTDFGISRIVESTTAYTQQAMGTLHYMPPEAFETNEKNQTNEKKIQVSKKSDQWAAAVVLYRLLTGQLPFPQKELGPYMNAVCNQPPPSLPNTVPAHIKRVLARALQKDPEKRFASAAAMRTALLTPDSATQRPFDLLSSRLRSASVSSSSRLWRKPEVKVERLLNFLNPLLTRLNQRTASPTRRPSEQPAATASNISNTYAIISSISNKERSILTWGLLVVGLILLLRVVGFNSGGQSKIVIVTSSAVMITLLITVFVTSLWLLFVLPVRLLKNLPISRRSLLFSTLTLGYWFVVLIFGAVSSLADISNHNSFARIRDSNWFFSALILAVIAWFIRFDQMIGNINPKDQLAKQMRLLAQSSGVVLVLSILSHIIALTRPHGFWDDNGSGSSFGIVGSLWVMLLSLVPKICFFCRKWVQKRSRERNSPLFRVAPLLKILVF